MTEVLEAAGTLLVSYEGCRRTPRGQQGQAVRRGRRGGIRQGDRRRIPPSGEEVRIDGFRPGKAPRRVLEAKLGSGVAREEAVREALPTYYESALARDRHRRDRATGDRAIISEEGPLKFDAVVEIRPVITVPGYDSLKVVVPNPSRPKTTSPRRSTACVIKARSSTTSSVTRVRATTSSSTFTARKTTRRSPDSTPPT